MTAIRGAITVKENTAEAITAASVSLIGQIAEKNNITTAVSIIISSTFDITAVYPAKAIREAGLIDAPLFSCVEPEIDGSLRMCIRVMVLVNADIKAKHMYLDGAKVLRPDIGE